MYMYLYTYIYLYIYDLVYLFMARLWRANNSNIYMLCNAALCDACRIILAAQALCNGVWWGWFRHMQRRR